jgi:hypothetical protein
MRRAPHILIVLCLLFIFIAIGGCATGPEPTYRGPGAGGRLIYDPDLGITREGAARDASEQNLYTLADKAFRDRNWQRCIEVAGSLIEAFPDGARAVDGHILRIRANLEAGRAEATGGFSKTATIDQWLFIYLTPEHDERLIRLVNRSAEAREYVRATRALSIDAFIDELSGDAFPIYNTGRLAAAQFDVARLLTYYLPALYLREYRRAIAELARDVCWLMYAAEDYNLTIVLAEELLAVNPPPSVKADALFIMGHSQRKNGAGPIAANTFGLLYRGAGLRDTDTRWRPYALMHQIHQTMQTSKGYIYDVTYYERALELLGEYELYRIENPNIPPELNDEFILLVQDVYDILARRDRNAASQYGKLGESRAKAYYIALAEEREAQRDKRIRALKEAP